LLKLGVVLSRATGRFFTRVASRPTIHRERHCFAREIFQSDISEYVHVGAGVYICHQGQGTIYPAYNPRVLISRDQVGKTTDVLLAIFSSTAAWTAAGP